MIMTKTPMMAPMIPRFTSSLDRRADPPLQIRSLKPQPVVGVEVRARAGSAQPDLAKIGDQRGSSDEGLRLPFQSVTLARMTSLV
jgi:hypothetical protein